MGLILIVDDDKMVVEIAAAALEARGHIVGYLPDGGNVSDVVAIKHPDVVVLDCVMPKLSGLDVLRKLRSSADSYYTAVLMLTGRTSSFDEEIALRAGANDYLRKPFNPDELVARVEALIDKSAQRQALHAR